MSKLRPILPEWYIEAAEVVTAQRKNAGDTSAKQFDIEKVIRSYVNAGQLKQIIDYTNTLTNDKKMLLIETIQKVNQKLYGFTPDFNKTLTNLDILETQGYYGKINPAIVYPRKYQEAFEAAIQTSHDTSKGGAADTSLSAAFNRVFGTIGKTVSDTFESLGIPLMPLMVIIVIIILLPYLRK